MGTALTRRRIAAQRAAGYASLATENEQLVPSALRPEANAALVAARQNTSKAATTISITSLMAGLPSLHLPA